jgi:CRP-like cAMP-binding protein
MRSEASLKNRLSMLRAHPYFCALSERQLAGIHDRVVVRRYRKGNAICLHGEPCKGLYLIASGAVRLVRSSPRGKEQVLHQLFAGQSFGGVSALEGGPMMANVHAVEDTLIVLLPADEFSRLVHRVPGIAVAVMRVWAARLRELSDLASDLALTPVVARVAGAILQLSDGKAVVRLPTREKLANLTGTVREVATRALGDLERLGVLRRSGTRSVAILDRQGLQRIYRQVPEVTRRKPRRAP